MAERTSSTPLLPIPFVGHRSGFLRRTAVATLVTIVLVALCAGVYRSLPWAGVYLAAALWSLGFFAITPFIFKAMLFDRRTGRGRLLIALKLFWMSLMLLFGWWIGTLGLDRTLTGSALVAGVVTPLVVVTLRVLGAPRPARPAADQSTIGHRS